MKKLYLSLLTLFLFAFIAFNSCKKDNETVPATKENLIGSYKLIQVTAKAEGIPEHSIYNEYLAECEKDDIYQLNGDFSYDHVDAGIKCDPAGDESSIWSLPLTNSIEIEGVVGTINKFDGKILVVLVTDNSGGFTYTVTMTYSKQ